jgi:hypothetical protein
MPEGPAIIARLFGRTVSSVSLVAGARRAAEVLLREGSEALRSEAEKASALSLQIIKSMGIPGDRLNGKFTADTVLEHQRGSLIAVIDSALLITMHAVVDDSMYQLLRAVFRETPERCEHLVSAKKVELSEVRRQAYLDLLKDKLMELENSLERASLLKKVDTLLSVLKPEPGSLNSDRYDFSREHLEELDQLRHDVVHGSGPRTLPTIQNDLEYLQFVLFTFWGAVALSTPTMLTEFAKGQWHETKGSA